MFKRNFAKVNPPKKFQAYSNQRMQLPTNGLTLQFRKPVLSYNALLPKPTSLYNINNTTFQKKFVFNKGKVSYDPQKQMIGSKLGKGVQDPTKGINVSLNFLRDNPGSKKPSRPVGRGIGNGRGKTSTRGHKGHKARSGGRGGSTFKNESINLYKKVKKFGKKNPFKLNWSYVNLDQLSQFIQHGRIDTSSLITAQTLKDAGIIKNPRDGVKLLADGYSTWNHKIDIQVAQTSQKAKIAVELAGGRVTKQWYNMVALNHLLHPHKYNFETKIGLPKLSREWRFENKTLKETIEEFEEN